MRFFLPLLLLPSALAAQDTIPAFPEARGWGATTLHECRALPVVVHQVTNTNNTGVGSFKAALDAVTATAYDIIIFRTGGRIYWTGSKTLDTSAFSCVYIAGQTAPGGGITITGNFLSTGLATDHLVMRYLTWRKHRFLRLHSTHLVLDHVSCSWSGSDGTPGHDCLNVGPTADVPGLFRTISNNLAYEPHEAHSTVMQFVGDYGSAYGNLLAGPGHRLPWTTSNPDTTGGLELANNIMYNWFGESGASAFPQTSVVDVRYNYYKRGPATLTMTTAGGRWFPLHWRAICANGVGQCQLSLFTEGNRSAESNFEALLPPDSAWRGSEKQLVCHSVNGDFDPDCPSEGGDVPLVYKRDVDLATHLGETALWPLQLSQMADADVADVGSHVGNAEGLSCGGAWVMRRDSMDTKMVTDFQNGTGRSTEVDFAPGPSPDPDEPGWVVPTPDAGTPCPDADSDGLPDEWETLQCGSATCVAPDSVLVSGYVGFEAYVDGFNLDNPAPWAPPTFRNNRFVYLLPVDTIPFGTDNLLIPDTTVIPRNANKVSIYNPAQDSVLTVTCQSYGASADSVTVDVRSRAWDRQGMRSAAEIRNRSLTALSC